MRARFTAAFSAVAIAAVLAPVAGCWVPPWDPHEATYACDAGNACVDGFSCISGLCLDCDGGNPACVTQCSGVPYFGCGNTECTTNPCLQDGGCMLRTALTGTVCSSGVCRNDGMCVPNGTEFNCVGGGDDDGDGFIDCADPDCVSAPCVSADLCLANTTCQPNGSCGGGAPTSCSSQPGDCFEAAGTCVPATGQCAYPVNVSNSCSDFDLCTTADQCLADGGCTGLPKTCTTPPGDCYDSPGSCNPADGGCEYPIDTSNACTDSNPCTVDSCLLNGSCNSAAYTCPAPTECQLINACDGMGGCVPASKPDFTPCTGGICRSGSCDTFDYGPSNFNPTTIANGGIGGDVVINCNTSWNTTTLTGSWCGGPAPTAAVITQDGGIQAVVLAMRSLNINSTRSLMFYGSRPAILAVWGNATIGGTLSVRSIYGSDGGAGANVPGCAGANAPNGDNCGGGGGGGGYGSPGADGGEAFDPFPNILGAAGSNAQGNVAIVPLRGGCRGGTGGHGYDPAGIGGHGGNSGGAVQVSAAGALNVVDGGITASGAGGYEGEGLQDVTSNGGGGGGSGGAILLEGASVNLNGALLTANGGGGAEGSASWDDGDRGNDGSNATSVPAAGGSGFTIGGNGGSGATLTNGAVTGQTSDYAGGGGGGGVGRIRVNSQGTCSAAGGLRSPQARGAGTCQDPIP